MLFVYWILWTPATRNKRSIRMKEAPCLNRPKWVHSFTVFWLVAESQNWRMLQCCSLRQLVLNVLNGCRKPAVLYVSSFTVFWLVVESQRCCTSVSSQCRAICKTVFMQDTAPTATQLLTAAGFCEQRVTACILNHTKTVETQSPRTDSK